MKTASRELSHLIRQLSKAEKRYCRLFLQEQNLKNRPIKLSLFDQIVKNPDLTEESLAKWVKKENHAGSYTVLKHQLKSQLLTALHRFHENNDAKARLNKNIHEAKILKDKGLESAAQSKLKTIKQEAEKYEFNTLRLEVIELEKEMAPNYLQFAKKLTEIQSLSVDFGQTLAQLKSAGHYWTIFNRLYQYHIHQVKKPFNGELPEVIALLNGEIPDSPVEPQKFKDQLDYYRARALSAFINSQTEQAFQLNQQLLTLFDQYPYQQLLYPEKYLAIYNNYLIDGLTLGKYDEVKSGIRELRSTKNKGAFGKIAGIAHETFRLTTLLELNLYLNLKDYREGIRFLKVIAPQLKEEASQLPSENFISIHYLGAYFHLVMGHFSKSLEWLRPILEEYSDQDAPVMEIYRHAQVLHLIAHFELGNFNYLAYALDNLQKQFLKKGLKEGPLMDVIAFLKKQIDKPVYEDDRETWEALVDQMQAYENGQAIFDFDTWALAKLEKTSMESIKTRNSKT